MSKRLLFLGLLFMACLTMSAQSAGGPSVDYTVDEVGTDFITISFTPNADAAGYAVCLFEAGTAEMQFAMFGPWMAFQTMGDMIRGWGLTYTDAAQYTWTRQNPGTDYEIYVQCWDANGTDADMIIIPVTTLNLGGDGLAEMTIEIGEFGGDEENGYYQWVTYTPNENVSVHRDIIIEKMAYESDEWGEERLIEYLKQDNPYDPYWDQYGVDVAQWNAEPDTWYIAFSIAKNALGEWGPLVGVEFKTPRVDGASGISEVASGKVGMSIDGSQVNVTGMVAGSALYICDMSGRMIKSTRASQSGDASIDISSLSRGVYIVTDGKTSSKFVK